MPTEVIFGGAGIIIANILFWVFAWGRRVGKVNQRLTNIEGQLKDPPILPQCAELFAEIREGLATLNGKVSTMLIMLSENQKNIEKKRLSRRSKKSG